MDLFSKIDVFEEKVHEQITERVSLFTNIMQDNEIFGKVILESSEYNDIDIGVAIDSSTKEIITDIQTSDKIITLMKNKFKKNQMIKPNDTTLPHGRRPRIFDSKNYSSNLTVSPFLNYFHQKQIEFRIRPNNFYSKATELSLVTSLFREMFKNQIRKKLYIAQNDSYLSQGINSARTKELLNINKSVVASKSSNLDSNNQSAILSCSTDRKALLIRQSIERLHPKPKVKENYIDDVYMIGKINECRRNGELHGKVDIDGLLKEMKINKKKQHSKDIQEVMQQTDDIVQDYFNNQEITKQLNDKIKEKELKFDKEPIEFERGELIIGERQLVKTNSKFYIKVNRLKKEDLTLYGDSM
jgi:hypothetical protein